jgi:hypothetical protein
MVNERVSVIKVSGIDSNIVKLFVLAKRGEVAPMPGIIIHKVGDGRFSVVRMLESGGKLTLILEIIDDVLRPARN